MTQIFTLLCSSKLCSSTNDNTSYIVTQLSKDFKAGVLPKQYHVVLDEAYPCTEQEMSPWKGRNLPAEKDTFNYYLSLNRQVIERAFGVLVQRWGIFWHPLRLSMHNQGVAVRVACCLHNVCIDDLGVKVAKSISRGSVPGFEFKADNAAGDERAGFCHFTDGTAVGCGYGSDLESCSHRDTWTDVIKENLWTHPVFSKFSKATVRT